MKLKVETKVDYNLFENLIVGALEGGSNYWYMLGDFDRDQLEDPGEPLSSRIAKTLWNNETFSIPVYDLENDEELLGHITRQSCENAFELLGKTYYASAMNILTEDDDAGDADIFFQLAVMGEVVYG